MTKSGEGLEVSRRTALAGAIALGGAAASSTTAQASEARQFHGRIAPTFAQSTPDFAQQPQARAGAPNIIVIVLDDVGFSDLGCYGGEISTPAIDGLAAAGLRYTNFRTTAVCSSTRASLLTGLNPHSAGMGWLTFADEGYPGYRGDLAADAVTLPETLNANGYLCYHVGKWHVNADAASTAVGPFENWPLQRGYHRAHWFQGHSLHYFRPGNVWDGNQRVEIDDERYYASDDFTNNAIRYLREHAAQAEGRPFFLSLAYSAAHSPLHAPPDDIAAQRGRYAMGWDRLREQRLARQIELGVVPPGTQLPPRNRGVLPWDTLSDDQRRLFSRYMEIYAAVVAGVDAHIARLLTAVDELGLRDDTLVLLLSDNGGSPDGGVIGTPNLFASGVGGVTLPEALAVFDDLGGPDTYPMYPMGWAMASNTPFKLYKHDTHLGGVADPLVVRWPNGFAPRGEVRRQYAHVCDLMPTLLACAGVRPLRERKGRPAKALQGVDFSATFVRGDAPETRREQYFEMNGTRALYADGWRLVSKGHFHEADDGWELYDLSKACNELEDVAAVNPVKVAQLDRRWTEIAHQHDVFPIDTRSLKEKSWAPLFAGGGRSKWELTAPLDLIPEDGAPPLIGRAHTIEITLAQPLRSSDTGVLFAFGNMFLGCVLYLKDGQLIHEFACAPRLIRTEGAVPVGATRIGIQQTFLSRPWRGALELLADGRRVAFAQIDPLLFGRPVQGFQLGRNAAVPVSRAYPRPFNFTGAIASATVEVDTSPYTAEEAAAALQPPPRAAR